MRRNEYAFTIDALRVSGYLPALKAAIAALCLSMSVVAGIMQFNSAGPHGTVARTIQLALAASSAAVGIWWLLPGWPSHRLAMSFVVWADLSVALGAAMNSTPPARLLGTSHMGLIGVFAAFLLGHPVLTAHCAVAAMAIFGFAAHSVAANHLSWFDLYIYLAPAVSSVILLPVLIQSVIEGGRKGIRRIVRQAMRDPMTGLRNRRGMHSATAKLVRDRPMSTLVAIVIDLDSFKRLNDDHGHHHGDETLKTVARTLQSVIRNSDIAARLGGDEFVVIAALDSPSAMQGLLDRLQNGLDRIAATTTASVGVAYQQVDTTESEYLDTLLRHADRAMYEAKRRGGDQFVRA